MVCESGGCLEESGVPGGELGGGGGRDLGLTESGFGS